MESKGENKDDAKNEGDKSYQENVKGAEDEPMEKEGDEGADSQDPRHGEFIYSLPISFALLYALSWILAESAIAD